MDDVQQDVETLFLDTRARMPALAEGRERQMRIARSAAARQHQVRSLVEVDAVEIVGGLLEQTDALATMRLNRLSIDSSQVHVPGDSLPACLASSFRMSSEYSRANRGPHFGIAFMTAL